MTLEENYDKVLDNFLRIDFKQMGILQDNQMCIRDRENAWTWWTGP